LNQFHTHSKSLNPFTLWLKIVIKNGIAPSTDGTVKKREEMSITIRLKFMGLHFEYIFLSLL